MRFPCVGTVNGERGGLGPFTGCGWICKDVCVYTVGGGARGAALCKGPYRESELSRVRLRRPSSCLPPYVCEQRMSMYRAGHLCIPRIHFPSCFKLSNRWPRKYPGLSPRISVSFRSMYLRKNNLCNSISFPTHAQGYEYRCSCHVTQRSVPPSSKALLMSTCASSIRPRLLCRVPLYATINYLPTNYSQYLPIYPFPLKEVSRLLRYPLFPCQRSDRPGQTSFCADLSHRGLHRYSVHGAVLFSHRSK